MKFKKPTEGEIIIVHYWRCTECKKIIPVGTKHNCIKTLKFEKPKKVNKTKLKKLADKLFSLHVRSHGRCQLAGLDKVHCGGSLQTMHIITRGNLRLRWDDQNVICGCAGHHVYYTYHPSLFDKLIEEYFPSQWKYIQEHQNELLEETYDEIIERLKV